MAKKVVIVEDDEHILMLYAEILTSEGFEVELARNGQEALDVLNNMSEPPSLILTDFMMPEMSGADLVRNLRKHTTLMTIPVVMISAKPLDEIGLGKIDFLKKPIDVDTILDKVIEYCGPAK